MGFSAYAMKYDKTKEGTVLWKTSKFIGDQKFYIFFQYQFDKFAKIMRTNFAMISILNSASMMTRKNSFEY